MCTKMKYYVVELKDPQNNRILQWLNVKTTMCIADLSCNMSSDPMLGTYTISVENGQALQTFVVEEIVLPRFEVTIEKPSTIFAADSTFPLKVCGKYTYGKGVRGNVNVTICRKSAWDSFIVNEGLCTTITGQTDVTGCFQTDVDANNLSLKNRDFFYYNVNIRADLEESGTGVRFSVFKTIPFSFAAGTLTFEAMDSFYKVGYPFGITLAVAVRDGSPLQFQNAFLEITFGNHTINLSGKTDNTGRASFSLSTSQWSGQVSIRGYINSTSSTARQIDPVFPDVMHFLQPYYSKAVSLLKLIPIYGVIPCGKTVNIRVEYDLKPSDLRNYGTSVKFYYVVIGKDGILLHGEQTIAYSKKSSLRGFLTVRIAFTTTFGTSPKMIGFLLLRNGFVTADRLVFNVEKCFPNQASLKFSQTEASPKAQLILHVMSSYRSLCAIRAVDKSVQISNEDKELTAEKVFDMFKDSERGGYPDPVDERQPQTCWWFSPFKWGRPYQQSRFVDVFDLFKETGLKILTNTEILQPVEKMEFCPWFMPIPLAKQPNESSQPANSDVRKYFPKTWLWSLVPIGKFGHSSIEVTVPDTITKFNARAFCVGDIGFALSSQVSLTVFKPFFVELTLPYSIIQGETLTLKASVFNYLNQCLKVQITLLNTTDFSVIECPNCIYSGCICANQAITFIWSITTNKIGLLTIIVRAEAVNSNDLCEGKKPYVPPSGNLDILQRVLLVKPRGVRKEITQNVYLCLNDSSQGIQTYFTLELPNNWVNQSESAYISVMGDILGTALQNLDHLIAMPYGCGEQNMLTMAPIVYVLDYLTASVQLRDAQKQTAIGYLQSGYQRELSYKRTDGSYSAFGMSDAEGSTWLTAFVIKVFYQCRIYIFIDDDNVLSPAVAWLRLQQQPDGSFINRGKLYHTLMKGGVEDDLSLCAYITAALLEGGTLENDPMVVQALNFLRSKVSGSTNTYTLALLAYTFALANDMVTRQALLDRLFLLPVSSGGELNWTYTLPSSGGSESASVELSSYVLLALITAPVVPANDILKAFQIVSWLTKQQNSYGGFSSTQDTVVAIQALAKYTQLTFNSKGILFITVSNNNVIVKEFKVDESNRILLQKEPLPYIPGTYLVTVKGDGCVFIQTVLKYNVVPVPIQSAFSISAKFENCKNIKEIMILYITVRYIGKRNVTNMVIIEVEFLSGFQLSDQTGALLQKMPFVKKVNIKTDSLTIYLDELDHTPKEYVIQLKQETEVHDLKPANIKVYDYYQTEENGATTYNVC
ncbi:alpha-2-macroglobulin-like protein 1 [Rhinoderma darwinii]|uniref:alpha-2-macroglobulin-like protein 1 n=1 Tax=Rhinoderma darwinii TaxID=43563 RepID=UPI003F67933D